MNFFKKKKKSSTRDILYYVIMIINYDILVILFKLVNNITI